MLEVHEDGYTVFTGNFSHSPDVRRIAGHVELLFSDYDGSRLQVFFQFLARVFYVGVDKGWHYIVFEFIEGVNIRDLVQHKGPLSFEETLQYTRQVAEALDHAWNREIVHRDIKPANLMITGSGAKQYITIMDFGLALFTDRSKLTRLDETMGTVTYMSPE